MNVQGLLQGICQKKVFTTLITVKRSFSRCKLKALTCVRLLSSVDFHLDFYGFQDVSRFFFTLYFSKKLFPTQRFFSSIDMTFLLRFIQFFTFHQV